MDRYPQTCALTQQTYANAIYVHAQGDLLTELLQRNAGTGIKSLGPSAQKTFKACMTGPCYCITIRMLHACHAAQSGSAQALSAVQDMTQNTVVSEVSNQAPSLTSSDATTNADNPIEKTAGQVCKS